MFKCYFLTALLALFANSVPAQIRVEILSRTDSSAFLGSGSDNRVRIHNLPKNAVVSISPGAAVHVKDDEYVLCRFGYYDEHAVLMIFTDDILIFSKNYKIFSTRLSGSAYNPLPPPDPMRSLEINIAKSVRNYNISFADLQPALEEGLLSISDTSCSIECLEVSAVAPGRDYIGPLYIGTDVDEPVKGPSASDAMTNINLKLKKLINRIEPRERYTIFLEDIHVRCREGFVRKQVQFHITK